MLAHRKAQKILSGLAPVRESEGICKKEVDQFSAV
jgi:hypothetical protein